MFRKNELSHNIPFFCNLELDQKKNSPYREFMKDQKLKIATDDFITLTDSLLQGIIRVRYDNGIITAFNEKAAQLLSLTKTNILNTHFSKYLDDSFFGFSIQKTLNEKKIMPHLHNPYVSQSLENSDFEASCCFGQDSLMIILQDIKERKTTNRLKDLGSMTAMLAHEIRNPLGGIKGFASLLRKDLENMPNLRQMAELIVDGTDNLNNLVTHILNFAHPLKIRFIPLNLIEMTTKLKVSIEMDEKIKKQLDNQKINFVIKPLQNEISLAADTELLRSCLFNLIINAIQAMPNGGNLTLVLDSTENNVIISVIDEGIGISKENLKKIFSAFFTTKADGNGFGLLEVNKVVQAHRGTIEVNSKLDLGTTFTLKIPK